MNHSARKRIRIHVEGCLDAVLASLLIESAGLNRNRYEVPMPSGGWQGALRRLREDLSKGIRAIAFLDADQSIWQARERVKRILTNFHIELRTDPVPHVAIRRGSSMISSVVIWAKPPEYREGTIEDLVCGVLGEDLCLETQRSLERVAMRMGIAIEDSKQWLRKIAPLVILSLRMRRGTFIWSPEYQRCGIDIRQELERYLDHQWLKPYRTLIRSTLQNLLVLTS